ncbi:MAG TPA: prolyl oligopeptidase family serine peptidase [Candidatus Acidoferrum sp.]|nr:prolyl oligopeptidase family serine peptidase [Candidatus Acidoferrum sp.]
MPWNHFRFFTLSLGITFAASLSAQQPFTLDQVLGAPFVNELTASKTGHRLIWSENLRGNWNVWAAEGPAFAARQLTNYNQDDGGELSELRFVPGGDAVIYVRGEGKNSAGENPNPTSNPAGAGEDIWLVPWAGGTPRKIDSGDTVRISAQGRIAYAKNNQVWLAGANSEDKPVQLFVRGKNEPLQWSPDGRALMFSSSRGDHNFVGIYNAEEKNVKFIAPSVDSDSAAVWSLDGKHIAFVRRPAVQRDSPSGFFIEPDRPNPWAIWIADADASNAREVWHSGATLQGSFPYMAGDTGGGVLNWSAGNTLVFASEEDGWQHLYALSLTGGAPKLLTPGNCEVEQWSLSPDGSAVLYNSNCGDTDRRHLWLIPLASGASQQLTRGDSIEWAGVFAGDSKSIAYLRSDARHFGLPFMQAATPDATATPLRDAGSSKDFPVNELVVPQPVTFKSADGLEIHAQLFLPRNLRAGEKRPALLFLHGGPVRQMLLGWHYMRYYFNTYAMNQFLASRGYVVLAINYRSGIGYGRAFREAPGRAGRGASEYQDVLAAGKYLQNRADVDPKRIGLWGGSYGGYLTALGLGHNSDIFAAGVDTHGVHDWPTDNWQGKNISPEMTKLAHDSSPVSTVDTWKSPVLFIHGDDDRNVIFSQTVDLVARLRARGVHIEQLIFPDEVHDFLLYSSWLRALQANSDFFDRQFSWPPK